MNKAIWLILVIALIPRLFIALTSKKALNYDDSGYETSAVSILEDGIYGFQKKPAAFKPPFYSFFLSLVYRIFGRSYAAVKVVQAVLGSLTCLLVYLIGLNLAGASAGLVAGLLSAANLSFIFDTGCLMPGVITTFLLSLLVLLLVRLRQPPSYGRCLLAGILAGVLALTRSEMIFFLPFIYLIGFLPACFKSCPRRLFLKEAAVVFAAFFLIVGIWTYRNWRVYRTFVPVTTSVGINLYSSYLPPQGKLFGWTAYDKTIEFSLTIKDEVARSKFLTKEAFRYIKANPDKLPRLELLKFAFFWTPFDWEIIGNGVYNFSFGFMLPFFIIGFIAGLRKWRQYFAIYAPVLYFQITTLLLYGSPRFRVSCEPFIIIFAAIGIMHLYRKFSSKASFCICLAVFFSANVLLYFNSTVLKAYARGVLTNTGLW